MEDSKQPQHTDTDVTILYPTSVESQASFGRPNLVTPLQPRIKAAVQRSRSNQTIVERDYAISYILSGIAGQPDLGATLVFKGGTALRKLLIPDYRFSEDLDFSASDAPTGASLEEALRQAVEVAEQQLNTQGEFSLTVARHTEREPHPGGQESFDCYVRFPWHPKQSNPLCRIKVEVTHDEIVLLPPQRCALIHGYEEGVSAEVLCYRIEEIVAEKMRTLLQTHQKLTRPTGFRSRPRARDYYDLWRLLGDLGDKLQYELLPDLLERKCAHREVSFSSLEDFFTTELVASARTNWERNLRPFVPDLPSCDQVLSELRALIPQYFTGVL